MAAGDERLGALIRAAGEGDHSAFEALYAATSGRLMSTAMRVLRDRALAEDALQEGFIKVWRNAVRFDATKSLPMTWLSMIVRRVAMDRIPKRSFDEVPESFVDEAVSREPADPALARCLGTLEDKHRNVLLASYVEGYTHEELAETLGVPLGTVKSWIRRAGTMMKECLEQ
jgi:RNA polymerase sigma-70 factor, ECF subfamily